VVALALSVTGCGGGSSGGPAPAAGIAIWTTDQGDPPGVLEFIKNQTRHVEVVGRHAKKAALE
jgi:hypothetical protein